jgi:hypothetical protein
MWHHRKCWSYCATTMVQQAPAGGLMSEPRRSKRRKAKPIEGIDRWVLERAHRIDQCLNRHFEGISPTRIGDQTILARITLALLRTAQSQAFHPTYCCSTVALCSRESTTNDQSISGERRARRFADDFESVTLDNESPGMLRTYPRFATRYRLLSQSGLSALRDKGRSTLPTSEMLLLGLRRLQVFFAPLVSLRPSLVHQGVS